jgi:hypothetical protein
MKMATDHNGAEEHHGALSLLIVKKEKRKLAR